MTRMNALKIENEALKIENEALKELLLGAVFSLKRISFLNKAALKKMRQ